MPTVAESGYRDYEADNWTGLFAPAGTPKEIVDKLHQAFATALKSPKIAEMMPKFTVTSIASDSLARASVPEKRFSTSTAVTIEAAK